MKHSLDYVFLIINGERAYQQQRWPGHTHTVGDYLTYMWHYYRKAEELDSTVDGSDRTELLRILEPVRKLAALGVACMEECGAVLRGDFDESNPIEKRIVSFGPHPIDREDVYYVIEKEREHQDKNWNEYDPSTSEELTMLRYYLNKADAAWTPNFGDVMALAELRKIVAIAVRCMQNHGAPPRLWERKAGAKIGSMFPL